MHRLDFQVEYIKAELDYRLKNNFPGSVRLIQDIFSALIRENGIPYSKFRTALYRYQARQKEFKFKEPYFK